MTNDYTLLAVLQNGRLSFEALVLMASLRAAGNTHRIILAEPQPGPEWPDTDPRCNDEGLCTRLEELGAEIRPFRSTPFGTAYPHGNKIRALSVLEAGKPFLFLDTDTLILSELPKLDPEYPAASMHRGPTWPKEHPGGATRGQIWKSLYDRFDLDFETSLDCTYAEQDWERYLYFNAGWFYGACPQVFGTMFERIATDIWSDPGQMLEGQALTPWLDQIALPLVISAMGGGRPPTDLPLDKGASLHYRTLPLLYAAAPDSSVEVLETLAHIQRNKKFLRAYPAFQQMIYAGKGAIIRTMFDRMNMPATEAAVRKQIKAKGLWIR